MYAIKLGSDNRVLSATYPQYASADLQLVGSLPEGNITDYRFSDGQYVYDPLPEPAGHEASDSEEVQSVVDYNLMTGTLEDPEVMEDA